MHPAILATSIAAAIVTLLLIGIDIVWALDSIKGNTWSEVIRFWTLRYPIIAYCWGGLGGHFFHGDWLALAPRLGVLILVWSACVVQIISMWLPIPSYVYFIVGAIVWALCWPV